MSSRGRRRGRGEEASFGPWVGTGWRARDRAAPALEGWSRARGNLIGGARMCVVFMGEGSTGLTSPRGLASRVHNNKILLAPLLFVPGPPHIPYDVLVHIFSFLDVRSLVAAGLVCWSWNSSANDNKLWKMNYSLFFSISNVSSNSTPVSCLQNSHGLVVQNSADPVFRDPNLNWKEVFHYKRAEYVNWSSTSNRAICWQCGSILWLSSLTCAAPHHCPKNGKDEVKLVPLLPYAVACYILNAHDRPSSSSDGDDTDSDSEDNAPR